MSWFHDLFWFDLQLDLLTDQIQSQAGYKKLNLIDLIHVNHARVTPIWIWSLILNGSNWPQNLTQYKIGFDSIGFDPVFHRRIKSNYGSNPIQ